MRRGNYISAAFILSMIKASSNILALLIISWLTKIRHITLQNSLLGIDTLFGKFSHFIHYILAQLCTICTSHTNTQMENQIRRISEEYACFAMPYWDLSIDAGLFKEAYIFNSGLGGPGRIDSDDCVALTDDGAWSVKELPLEHICHEEMYPEDNPTNGCCLKRLGGYSDLSAVASYTHFINTKVHFGAEHGFRAGLFNKFHNEAHIFSGGNFNNYTHMISRFSSEDPLFYMLHSWLDFIFVVWKQCHSYNEISSDELDGHPFAYFAYPKQDLNIYVPSSELDAKLYYVPMNDLEWFEKDKYEPTARKLWDEHDWKIQYERGTFIARSHLTQLCDKGWDTSVILKNSDETKDIVQSMRSDMSPVDEYQQKTWEYIEELMRNDDDEETFSKKDYLQTWDAKTCNFQRQRLGKEPCYKPQEYEKCGEDDYARRHELTLDELLSKEGVSGNDCLEEVRFTNYAWAKAMNQLYELCMGDFDDYFVCESPKVDFMTEYDEEGYYRKMRANTKRMRREHRSQNKEEEDEEDEELDVVLIGDIDIGNYPRFVVFRYLLIAFIFGGAAFIAMVSHCCNEYNTKLKPMKHESSPSFRYGSVMEML